MTDPVTIEMHMPTAQELLEGLGCALITVIGMAPIQVTDTELEQGILVDCI